MITFALAIVLMLATPGPGVLSAAGVGAGFGAAAGLRYVAGLCIGQALVYAAVAGLMAGLLLQPINPKAYAVLTALITGFPLYENAYWSEVAIKFVILNLIWVPIHVVWVLFGVSLKRLNLSSTAQRAINISMALSMLLVVGLAAWTLV